MTETNRFDAAYARARERLQKQKEEFDRTFVPVKREPLIAESVVEGRTVAEWAARVDALQEQADDLYRQTHRLVVVDCARGAAGLPSKAVAAVERWRAAGSPTEFSVAKKGIDEVRAEAEKHAALAQVELGKAAKLDAVGEAKRAKRHLQYAKTQQEKADKLFERVAQMTAAWQKEHP